MGQSYHRPSTPPPLVEVPAPSGRFLVPPYTPFTVEPPPRATRRGPRIPRHPRTPRPRPDYIVGEDEGSEDDDEGGMNPFGPRNGPGRGGGRMPGMPGMGMGMGMGPSGRGGARPPFIYDAEGRPHAHPASSPMPSPGMGSFGGYNDMAMGGPPFGGMPPGMRPPNGPGMGAGMGMGMGNMPTPELPPGYSSFPTSPQPGRPGGPNFRGGAEQPHINPYAYPPASPPSISPSTPSSQPAAPRPRTSTHNARVPMGAYTKSKSKSKSKSPVEKQSTSTRLNRNQPPSHTVGPSGKEWIPGDAFLDACTCTVNCTCREGHRVLYHSKDEVLSDSDENGGSGGGGGRPRYAQGEIRYILKKDLGRDCGDHKGCARRRNSSGSSDDEGGGRRDKGRKGKKEKDKEKEDKQRKAEFNTMKNQLLSAFDEKFEEIKRAKSSKASSIASPRPPFTGLHHPTYPGAGMAGMNMDMNPAAIDPMLAQKMGGLGLGMDMPNPYAMPASGMPGRQMRSAPGRMEMGGRVGFEDDMPMPMDMPMGMGTHLGTPGMKMNPMRKRSGGPPMGFEDPDMPFYTSDPRLRRGVSMVRGQYGLQRGGGSEDSEGGYRSGKGKGRQMDLRGRSMFVIFFDC